MGPVHSYLPLWPQSTGSPPLSLSLSSPLSPPHPQNALPSNQNEEPLPASPTQQQKGEARERAQRKLRPIQPTTPLSFPSLFIPLSSLPRPLPKKSKQVREQKTKAPTPNRARPARKGGRGAPEPTHAEPHWILEGVSQSAPPPTHSFPFCPPLPDVVSRRVLRVLQNPVKPSRASVQAPTTSRRSIFFGQQLCSLRHHQHLHIAPQTKRPKQILAQALSHLPSSFLANKQTPHQKYFQ